MPLTSALPVFAGWRVVAVQVVIRAAFPVSSLSDGDAALIVDGVAPSPAKTVWHCSVTRQDRVALIVDGIAPSPAKTVWH